MTLPVEKPAAGSTNWHPDIWHLIDVVNGIEERIRDVIGAALAAGSGIALSVSDAGDIVTINNTSLADSEAIQDMLSTFLVAGTNVTLTYNDGAGTLTVAASGGGLDAEAVRDTVAAALVAGSGVTITHNDGADTITITASGALDAEGVRDTIGSALVAGAGITITINDAGDTITIASTAVDLVHSVGNSGTALTVDATSSSGAVKKVTLDNNCSITLAGGTSGQQRYLDLWLKQDGTGNRVITWVTTVKWDGGAAPTLSSGPNVEDRILLTHDGTNWYGQLVGRNYA